MPRLPDKYSLGESGSMRTGRTAGQLTTSTGGSGAMMAAVGKGVEGLANKVGVVLGAEKKENDALDLVKAEAEHRKGLMALEQSFDTDPDYTTYGERHHEGARGVTERAAGYIRDPRMREKWLIKAGVDNERSLNGTLDRGLALERQHKQIELDTILGGYRTAYVDPNADEDRRAATMRDMESTLIVAERSGLLTPLQVAKMREEHVQGAYADRAEQMLLDDPFEVLRDLRSPSVGGRAQGVSADGLAMIKQFEGFDGEAYADGRQTSIGYGTKGRPGETITQAEADARLQSEAGRVASWVQDNITVGLTQGQFDALVSFGFNLGEGSLAKLKDDINAGRFDKVARRMVTFNKAFDEEGREKTEYTKGLTRRRIAESRAFLADGPRPVSFEPEMTSDGFEAVEAQATSDRFRHLSPDRRRVLINKAEVAARAEAQRVISDSVALVSLGDPLPVGDDGQTHFDRVISHLTPHQQAAARTKLRRAQTFREQIEDSIDLTDEQIDDRADQMFAARNSVPAGEVDAYRRAYEDYVSYAEKLKGARQKDPVATLEGSRKLRIPAVKELRKVADIVERQERKGQPLSEQEVLGYTLEARLEAQQRLHPDREPRLLTKREAVELLIIPKGLSFTNPGDLRQYRSAIEAATERALERYGEEWAERVIDDAVQQAIGSEVERTQAERVITRYLKNEIPARRELERETNRARAWDRVRQKADAWQIKPPPASAHDRPPSRDYPQRWRPPAPPPLPKRRDAPASPFNRPDMVRATSDVQTP